MGFLGQMLGRDLTSAAALRIGLCARISPSPPGTGVCRVALKWAWPTVAAHRRKPVAVNISCERYLKAMVRCGQDDSTLCTLWITMPMIAH